MRDPGSGDRTSRWYVVLPGLVVFGALGLTITGFAGQALLGLVGGVHPEPAVGLTLAGGLALLAGFLAATAAIGRLVFRLSLADLRWTGTGPSGRWFLSGFGAGLLAITLVLVLGVVVAGGHWRADTGTPGAYLGRIGLLLLVLAPAALAEEVMFRGVPMVVLERWVGRPVALGVLAVLFGLAHARNPDVTVLSLFNIALAGLVLGAAFYAPGGIWTAWGLHLGWNWAISALDAPVSGYDFGVPLIDYLPGHPRWLTGGSFGPEGGLLASGVLLGLVWLTLRWWRFNRPGPEASGPAAGHDLTGEIA